MPAPARVDRWRKHTDEDAVDTDIAAPRPGKSWRKERPVADLYLKALESERKKLWAECRLKGLARGTPERLRIEELDRLLAAHRAKQAG